MPIGGLRPQRRLLGHRRLRLSRGDLSGPRGVYLFGDYCSGRIWGLDAAGPNAQTPVLLYDTAALISSFGEDQAGNLYLVDHAGDIWSIKDV